MEQYLHWKDVFWTYFKILVFLTEKSAASLEEWRRGYKHDQKTPIEIIWFVSFSIRNQTVLNNRRFCCTYFFTNSNSAYNYQLNLTYFSRCKRASNICDIRDLNCINQPEQYSFHFVTFVSQLPIPDEGRIDFFQMKGPAWVKSNTNFDMDIMNVRCPHNIPKADSSYFRTKREANKVTLSVVRPIQGPQEIEIQLQMELYINSVFHGKVVSTIFIFVSEHTF